MKLEVCIHCHNYQKRLTWMLSSILQQKGDFPEIEVSLSYLPNTGNPTNEEVIDFFINKGIKFIKVPLNDDQYKNRAIPRNIRAKETEADWILYADSDMVYSPYFFEDIKKQLNTDRYKNEHKVIGADRHSLDIQYCVDYFNNDKREYPCEIENVADLVDTWPVKHIHGRNIAAGNFQLAKVEEIKKRGGVYSGRKRDYWRYTKSDRQFRVHMGGRVPMNVKKMYHLNHDRGGPDIQR